ncbi:MAG: glycosyltransferase family 2 protein [Anaerolineae bacterium]
MQNTNRPLVSIVTPSFNQAAFLPATLHSILSQNYDHLELIVMDGGSTDGSVSVLEAIDDPRLTWVSEPDRGQSHALNKGMARARGDILTYLNSDDLLTPNTVAFIVEYFETHPDIDLLFGDCAYIDAQGQTTRVVKGIPFELRTSLTAAPPGLFQQGAFWRRRVYERVGEFDESLHYTMDSEYWVRAGVMGCSFAYVPGVRGQFRFHGESKTVSQVTAFWRDWRTSLDKLYARPELPREARNWRAESIDYLDWHDAKMAWVQKDYATARPMLRRFLRGKKWVRRGLAAPMLVDSYLGTPFTRTMTGTYKRLRGVDLLAP